MIVLVQKISKRDKHWKKVTLFGLSFSFYKKEIGVRFYMRDVYDMTSRTILFFTKMKLKKIKNTDQRFAEFLKTNTHEHNQK